MPTYPILIALLLATSAKCFPKPRFQGISNTYDAFPFMTRSDWGARPPLRITPLNLPAPLVIIHHSYLPSACYSTRECIKAMNIMQDMHQIGQGWDDIGYNFAVGGDGAVYEGRGWDRVGAHALGYNFNSIGIVLIGDWTTTLPPDYQLEAAKKLIAKGVDLGYVSLDYVLLGHRQVIATECPGEALYREIMTWDRFQHYDRVSMSLADEFVI